MRSPARAPERRSATAGGTNPSTSIVTTSGPDTVSPPTSATPWRSASAYKPSAKPASQRSSECGIESDEQRPCGFGAHRGQVAQIHGQRLMPDRVGGRARQEMTAFDERIRRGHQGLARSRRQQCSVVTHAEQDVAAWRTA